MDAAATVENASVAKGEVVQPHSVAPSDTLVPEHVAAELIPEALVWASLNGLVVGDRAVENSGTIPGVGLVHAPMSLLPTPFRADAFNFGVDLSTLFNDLVDKVSQDAAFLQHTLSRTQKADEFTARLLKIHSKILEEGVRQNIRLGLHRSDYMLDGATGSLLQVELNTISSSFSGLGSLVSKLHKYLVSGPKHIGLESSRVPENQACDGFAEGLALAWEEYGDRSAAVLMIVQPVERNMYDQQWISFKLKDLRTLAEVHSTARLSPDGTLYVGEQVISVVYYRAGYTPNDYPSEIEWDARLLLERSAAVKCPTISYHLTGAKKIQQELARPGVLERFVKDARAVSTLKSCFAGLWGLEEEGSEGIIEEAIRAPHGFVLKPQREGGGNNIYGEDVAKKLIELKARGGDALAAYILMQRIFPKEHTSYLVRGGAWSANKTISELGIYGVYVRNGDREVLNVHAGHLLRTKTSDSNEGGVATGFAVLDSPYLI
ncbi:unnamed protein product [Calypogeia fissa]